MASDSDRIDVGAQIRNGLRILREQKWLVLLCLVLAAAASFAYVQSQRKEYRATAKVLFEQQNLTALLLNAGVVGGDPVRQAATDQQLAGLSTVQAEVARMLKLARLPDAVGASPQGDSNIVALNVEDRDPNLAASFANGYAKAYIAFRRDANQRRYRNLLGIVKARIAQTRRRDPKSPDLARLRDQARLLEQLSTLQTGDAQVVQTAGPPATPFKPRRVHTVVLGAIFGLLLGLALALLRDKLDRRLKSEEQVREILPGVPVVGAIPKRRRGEKGRALVSESFHTLQTNVSLLSPNGHVRSLLVTSASPGDGKSTVTANLALAMGAHGRASIVLEADLRRPSLSQALGFDGDRGVSRILTGDATVESSLIRAAVEPSKNGDGPTLTIPGQLSLIPAGPVPPNPQVLLNERRLETLLAEARTQSDTVIVDGPPIGLFGDMLPIAKRVDGVIVAVRLYHSRRDALQRFAQLLESAGIKPIGVVLLGVGVSTSDYDYYY
jgi:capsular exopolysaccharide synthesis family protein